MYMIVYGFNDLHDNPITTILFVLRYVKQVPLDPADTREGQVVELGSKGRTNSDRPTQYSTEKK